MRESSNFKVHNFLNEVIDLMMLYLNELEVRSLNKLIKIIQILYKRKYTTVILDVVCCTSCFTLHKSLQNVFLHVYKLHGLYSFIPLQHEGLYLIFIFHECTIESIFVSIHLPFQYINFLRSRLNA